MRPLRLQLCTDQLSKRLEAGGRNGDHGGCDGDIVVLLDVFGWGCGYIALRGRVGEGEDTGELAEGCVRIGKKRRSIDEQAMIEEEGRKGLSWKGSRYVRYQDGRGRGLVGEDGKEEKPTGREK